MAHTHSQLCELAVNWLKRNHARGGHGCHVAVTECKSGHGGEMPDAIGWVYTGGHADGSIVVECKTSRSDFLADRGKPHRAAGGMGNWRYFLAPEGLIKPDELPAKWGLVEANARGHLKTVVGPYQDRDYYLQIERLQAAYHDAELHREMYILVRLFSRVADPHAANQKFREIFQRAQRASEYAAKLDEAKVEIFHLKRKLENLGGSTTIESVLAIPRSLHI